MQDERRSGAFSLIYFGLCATLMGHTQHTHTHNNTNGEKREERKKQNKKQESKAIHHRRREAQQSLEGEQKAKPRIVSFFSFFFLIHLSRARPESGGAFSMRYTHTHTRNRAAARSSLLFVFSFFFLYYFGLF
jgi:Flp pilus assembly protein TadB